MTNWPTSSLDKVASVFNGKTPSKDEQRSEGHPVLKIRNVSELGLFRGKFESFVEPAFAGKHATKKVRAGDTLILNAAHNADYVASKTFRASTPTFGALATGEWLIVRPNELALDAGFTNHWINAAHTRIQLRELVNGIHLYPKDVARLKIPVPPLEEQRRIAAILDEAETLRTQRHTAIAHLDSLTQSLFLEMFSDAETKGWSMETIAAVAHPDRGSMRTGPFGSQLLHSEFVAEGVSVLGIDNAVANEFRWGERRFISEAKYRELKRYTVKPGDVLITIMGTCGRCAVVPDDIPVAINTKHICCITLDKQKCMPEFLHAYFLLHPIARKYLAQTEKGAIMAGLNMGLIQAMPIPLPPLALQQTFATRIQAIESLKATHRAALAELDALFASLQQRAFAGKLTAPAKRSFAELGQLDAPKGVESLVYAAKRLHGKGHYWPTKAQYFADKRHLERYGRSIYGETYVAMERGPVPQAAYNASRALAEGELICEFPMDVVRAAMRREGNQLIALREADTEVLSAQERECLDWAIRYVKDLSFDQLQTASHDSAWQKTAANAPMAWRDIVATLAPEAQKRLLAECA